MTTWVNDTKPFSSNTFLLKEDTYFLLLETGDKIVLTRTVEWTDESKPTSTWSLSTKAQGMYSWSSMTNPWSYYTLSWQSYSVNTWTNTSKP